jgi:hypothetical protein
MKCKMLPIAFALASVFAVGQVYAQGHDGDGEGHQGDPSYSTDISLHNHASFNFENSNENNFKSNAEVKAKIKVIGVSQATVDDKQLNHDNRVSQDNVNNNAKVGNNDLNGASGNIGVNVAAGYNNQQANQAAISSIAGTLVAPTEDSGPAPTVNVNVNNSADAHSHGGNAPASATANASGNHSQAGAVAVGIGGTSVAAAVALQGVDVNIYNNYDDDRAWGTASTAAINVLQDDRHNQYQDSGVRNAATVGGNVLNGASGNIGVNVAAGSGNQQKNDMALSTGGTRAANASVTTGQQSFGNQDQIAGGTRTTTTTTQQDVSLHGHFSGHGKLDLDNDSNGDRHEHGDLFDPSFRVAGHVDLEGTASGMTRVTTIVAAANTAVVGANVLNGASGNIGVNVAAGNGNQQVNSLAIASAVAR